MGRSCFLFVIFLLHVFHSPKYGHGKEPESLGSVRCKKHELEALLKFKHSFTSDPMKRLSSWVGDDCCEWEGVTCDNVTHNVVTLNLRGQVITFDEDDLLVGSDPDQIRGYAVGVACPYSSDNVSMVSSGVSSALLELKHLTYLDLSGNDFSGSRIPTFIGSMKQLRYLNLISAGFSGSIPHQLGNLKNLVHLDLHVVFQCPGFNDLHSKSLRWASGLKKLQTLDLSYCDLSRAHDTFRVLKKLPSLSLLNLSKCSLDISHLTSDLISNTSNTFFPTLHHLNLPHNSFYGPLPPVLKHIVSLKSLNLKHNGFSASVPLWLANMRQLEVVDLSHNELNYVEGGIIGIMGNPCNFKHLDLSYNTISQVDILEPSMSSLECASFELQYLDLRYNRINGSLSSLLGQLINLNHLDLSYNKFIGQLPASFANLSALKYLDLSRNKLNGTIPDFTLEATEIEHIDISSNSLQGTIFGIGNLSKLVYLDMNFNSINLHFDPSFNWSPPFQLQAFNVHSCGINSVFPQWIRNQTQIRQLDLSNTSIIPGEVPGWLWNMSNILDLRLSDNQLTGSLPSHSCNFGWLDLHNNFLTGTVPTWLGNSGAEIIDLSSNMLSGAIFEGNNASSFFDIGLELMMLDLSDNMLSGEIQFGNIDSDTQLQILGLRGNHFNGPIRPQICNLEVLLVLELSHNHLSGHIPRCLGSMPFSIDEDPRLITDKSLQVKEIVKGIVEVFTGTKGGESIINLSSNNLVGTIPEELTNISALYALNLSYNHLTGHIPKNIGYLEKVESLDLSNNNISGTIPKSLSSISSLSTLNLSNNHLHGPIPRGSQLQTLVDPSIYAGNSGLCGFPLPDCTKHELPTSSTNVDPTTGKKDVDKEDKYEKLWLILAVMSGVATGFWGVVGTLVIKRSWRQAYFRYVEDVGDRIYVPIKVRVNRFKRRFNENS